MTSAGNIWLLLAAASGLALLAAIAYRWSMFTMAAFLVLGPFSNILHMTYAGPLVEGMSIGAVRPIDALLVAMMGATLVRIVVLSLRQQDYRFQAGVRSFGALLVAWFVLEIVRNIVGYGLSAPGEFRYLYLVLVLPVYVAVFFVGAEERRRLLKAVVLTATLITLCCVPVIGLMKGWGVGPTSRFLPSVISLGLVLGWVAFYLAVRAGGLRVSPRVVWLLALPVAALVLVDGHRSVWLVTLVTPITLLLVGEFKLGHVSGRIVPVGAAIGLLFTMVIAAGVNPVPYVAARSQAFIAPDRDRTANWREVQWEAQLEVWRQHRLLGQGFGGYWTAGKVYGGSGLAPHSLYVQTLAKIGVVGLTFLLGLVVSVAVLLTRAIVRFRRMGRRGELDYALVVMGVTALVAALVYGIGYPLDYYALLFVGLGVAAAVHGRPQACGAVARQSRSVSCESPGATTRCTG
jgi:O-antigen ligase